MSGAESGTEKPAKAAEPKPELLPADGKDGPPKAKEKAGQPSSKSAPDEKPASPERDAETVYGADALAQKDAADAERIRRLGRLDPTFSFEDQVRNTGAAAWGEQARVYQTNYYQGVPGDRPNEPSTHPLTSDTVLGIVDSYAKVANHDELVGRLREHHLQILSGSPGTGRRTTATVALMDALHGDGHQRGDGICACNNNVANLLLDPKTRLSALLSWRTDNGKSLLADHHGYLLELTAGEWGRANELTSAVLGSFRQVLQGRSSFLILLVDDELPFGARSTTDEVLTHVTPTAEDMLAVKLSRALGAGRASELMADSTLRDSLEMPSSPRDVAALARELIAREKSGEALADVLARSSGRLKESIREKLRDGTAGRKLPSDQPDDSNHPLARIALRKQAFLIAAAVLADHRLTEVLDATDQLIARLDPTEPARTPAVRERFGYRIEDLLSFLQARSTEARDTWESTAHPRTVRLGADQMVAAIIDVCWNEYAGLREPLLHWLRDLAEGDPMRKANVWQSAAQMIGKLATYDFPLVLNTVISPWASSRRLADREAASTALEVVALNEPLRPLVRGLLATWIRSGSFNEQYTSVLAYQTGLGEMFTSDAWAGLTRLVEDSRYAWSHSLAFGLDNLAARPDRLLDFLPQLAGWSDSKRHRVRLQAARCFALLTRRNAAVPNESWPLLLRAARDDPASLSELATIWRSGLDDQIMRALLWKRLGDWIRRAAHDAAVGEPLRTILEGVAEKPALRRRLRFNLRRWRHAGPSRFLDSLIEQFEKE